jgi:hypothetical protein
MGNYPTPPSRRWAYDRDNTQVTCWRTDVEGIDELTGSQINALNDEDDDKVDVLFGGGQIASGQFVYLCYLFPEVRKLGDLKVIGNTDLTGRFGTFDVEYSDDTTTGQDGSWASVAAGLAMDETFVMHPNYREDIQAAAAAAPHAAYRLKLSFAAASGNHAYLAAVHLYGLEAGAADRLSFTDGAGTELPIDLDFEECARGASDVHTFYVKNVSGGLTAQGIVLSVEQGPSYGNASSWTLLSLDGITYAQTRALGDLAPGQISAVISIRCAPPTNAELGTLSCRITPSVAAWV